jgi:hypothetical protein
LVWEEKQTVSQPLFAARSIAVILVALASAGCQMIPIDEGSADVRVLEAAGSAGCERLGNTKVKVLDKVLFVGRSEEKMARELAQLARNEAVEMSGNAVVPEGDIEKGSRPFGIYRCPDS